MIVNYTLNPGISMTDEQKKEVEEAAKRPIVYDEDSPEMTEVMKKAFREACRGKSVNRKEQVVASDEIGKKVFARNYV